MKEAMNVGAFFGYIFLGLLAVFVLYVAVYLASLFVSIVVMLVAQIVMGVPETIRRSRLHKPANVKSIGDVRRNRLRPASGPRPL